MSAPGKVAKKASHINWQNLHSSNKNLTLWGQPIDSVKLTGDGKVTQALVYTIYDGSQLSSQESNRTISQWKSKISNISRKPARTLSAKRTSTGASQTRNMWDANDSIVLLTSTKKDGSQSIEVQFLQKDYAKSVLGVSDPDVVSERTYYSADYAKSFVGKLNEYDESKKAAKIAINGQVSTLSMDTLSDEDQAYVKKMGPYVAVYRGLKMSFKEIKAKAVKKGQLSITEFNYDIAVRNNASTQIDNVKVDYHIYYYVGDTQKAGSVLNRTSGSKTINIYPKMTDYLSTDKMELVKNIVKGRSGG